MISFIKTYSLPFKNRTDAHYFEELMHEQIENLKASFQKSNKELREQIEEKNYSYKKQLYDLKKEFENVTHLKDVFLKQINDIRKFQKYDK